MVMFQMPAESFAALDFLTFDKREDVSRLPARRLVAKILMRPFVVIVMSDEFRDQMPQVLLAADDEVIQKLLTQRLNESFREGIEVRSFCPTRTISVCSDSKMASNSFVYLVS